MTNSDDDTAAAWTGFHEVVAKVVEGPLRRVQNDVADAAAKQSAETERALSTIRITIDESGRTITTRLGELASLATVTRSGTEAATAALDRIAATLDLVLLEARQRADAADAAAQAQTRALTALRNRLTILTIVSLAGLAATVAAVLLR